MDAAESPVERDAMQQLALDFEVAIKDNALMGEIFDADDRLKAAFDKVKQLQLENNGLQERLYGLMNETNEQIRPIKSLRKQIKALEGK